MKKIRNIDDLDAGYSANMGTARGQELIEQSIASHGLGRGICVDKNGLVIAGAKVLEAAKQAGITKIKVVRTNGERLVAVKRTDLSLTDAKAKELAVLDNRAGELNLFWDQSLLEAVSAEFGKEMLGFDSLMGLSTRSDTWKAGKQATKAAATFNAGSIYTMQVQHEPFVAWEKSMFEQVGYNDEDLNEELKRRLGF